MNVVKRRCSNFRDAISLWCGRSSRDNLSLFSIAVASSGNRFVIDEKTARCFDDADSVVVVVVVANANCQNI